MGEVLRNRPLLSLTAGLLIGLTLREYLWNAILLVPLFALLKAPRPCLVLCAGFLIGALLSPAIPQKGVQSTRYIESEARIVSVPRVYPNRIAYEIEVQGHRLVVTDARQADRSLGDQLRVAGLVKPLREGSEAYLLSKGIVGRFSPVRIGVLSEGPSWSRMALQVREAFIKFSQRTLAPERAAILDALCFNVEGALSDEQEESLRSTGTIHIISASGLHVLILAISIDWLLGFLPIPRPARIVALGLILGFYAAAAGLQPAIIRSVVMSMVGLIAYWWNREGDLLSSLALAASGYLVIDPMGVYNLGFQFSFLTVAAFGLFGAIKDHVPKTALAAFAEQAKDAFQTTHVAYWATLPLLLFYFGTVSIMAIPSNLIIVPVVMVLVIGGIGAFALSHLWQGFGQILMAGLVDPLCAYLNWVLGLFGNLIKVDLAGGFFSGYWLLIVYLLLSFLVRERVRPA
ncbi:MAG: ComEC/Rec2 family competence protein [Chlorobia bacterium]|nr:ComEC/Rec2 family competence protein [Fimbriimonadaceae bacterium]